MRGRSGIAALAMLLAVCGAQAQDNYRLEATDRFELWTPVDESLRRTVSIGPDGWISLPLVGHMQAAGLTASELEAAIRERLKRYYKEEPDLTVMLLSEPERPQTIYVTGDVATPGAYPFRPGLLVAHGLTMAGGLQRSAGAGSDEERLISLRGDIDRQRSRLSGVSAQVVRISAEIDNATTIAPEGLMPEDVKREQVILNARLADRAGRKQAHDKRIELRQKILSEQRDQLAALDRQIALAQRRLDAISKLTAKGFANEAQLLELQGNIAEFEGNRNELQTDISSAELDIADEISRYQTELAERRAQLMLERRDSERERDAARSTLADTRKIFETIDAGGAVVQAEEPQPLTISVVRTVNGKPVEYVASELSQIQPGDLVRVGRGTLPASMPRLEDCGGTGCATPAAPAESSQSEAGNDQRSPS